MTNPAEYISGRTVQEQMNELISYVDTRAASVALDAIASDMASLAQAVQDAQDAQAAAEQARDTAVSTVSDCVKKTPGAAQTITGQDLIVSGADVQAVDLRATGNLSVGGTAAVTGGITGNVTGNLTGNVTSSGASAFSGTVTVPTVATGTFDTKAANGTKVKNELDNYSAMVRTTGAQNIAGVKTFTSNIGINANIVGARTGTDITQVPASAFNTIVKEFSDGNNHISATEYLTKNTNGSTWNVRNFYHYYTDNSNVSHVARLGVYYTIENSDTTVTVKKIINVFIDNVNVSSETVYTKVV